MSNASVVLYLFYRIGNSRLWHGQLLLITSWKFRTRPSTIFLRALENSIKILGSLDLLQTSFRLSTVFLRASENAIKILEEIFFPKRFTIVNPGFTLGASA